MAQNIKLKTCMKNKIAKIENCISVQYAKYQGERKIEICVKMHFFLCLQRIKMRRSTREEPKIDK